MTSKYTTIKEFAISAVSKVRAGKWFAPSNGVTVQLQTVDGKPQVSLLNHYTTQEGTDGKAAFFFTTDLQALKKLAIAIAKVVEIAEALPTPQQEESEADKLKAELEAVKAELARARATKTVKSKKAEKAEKPAEIPTEIEVDDLDDLDLGEFDDLLKVIKKRR